MCTSMGDKVLLCLSLLGICKLSIKGILPLNSQKFNCEICFMNWTCGERRRRVGWVHIPEWICGTRKAPLPLCRSDAVLCFLPGCYRRCHPLPGPVHGHSVQTFPVPQSLLGGLVSLLSHTATGHLFCTQRAPSLLMLEFCERTNDWRRAVLQRSAVLSRPAVKAEQWQQSVLFIEPNVSRVSAN